MCEAGRIRHHLKHNLWRPESTILFVGYQAEGTLEAVPWWKGEKEVKTFGETIFVRANIEVLEGVSGHADKPGLIRWIRGFEKKPRRVFVVHGEDTVCDAFAACLREEYAYDASAPYSGAVYDLAKNITLKEGFPFLWSEGTTEAKRKNTPPFSVWKLWVAASWRSSPKTKVPPTKR